jgi:hypothetical protein
MLDGMLDGVLEKLLHKMNECQRRGLYGELRRAVSDYPYYPQKYLKISVKSAQGVGLVPLVLNRA